MRYLLPAAVVRYIEENGLYLDEASSNMNKEAKEVQAGGDKEREGKGKGNAVGGLRVASGVSSSTSGA